MVISSSYIGLSTIGLITITIPVCIIPFYIPESPKWLYSNYKLNETREVLYRIAAINKVELKQDIKFDKEDG